MRSTKAGTVVPATPGGIPGDIIEWPALNEGRDRSPGDTLASLPGPGVLSTLNEGRDRSPGDTRAHTE